MRAPAALWGKSVIGQPSTCEVCSGNTVSLKHWKGRVEGKSAKTLKGLEGQLRTLSLPRALSYICHCLGD